MLRPIIFIADRWSIIMYVDTARTVCTAVCYQSVGIRNIEKFTDP